MGVKCPSDLQRVECQTQLSKHAAHELRILRQGHHPNIAMFFGAAFDETSKTSSFLLAFEMIYGRTLDKYVSAMPRLDVDWNRLSIAMQMCWALRYLHGCMPKIVHGDLADSNVMVEEIIDSTSVPCITARPKLLDFGLAQLVTQSKRVRLGGQWRYLAPESIRTPEIAAHPSIDMFAF